MKKTSSGALTRNLSVLLDINESVSRHMDLKISLRAVLKILADFYDLKSGSVFLVDPDETFLSLVASVGYNTDKAKRVYKLGEGLTGRAAETGKPIIVPQVSKEPLFLNRMSTWDPEKGMEQTYIGVPINLDYNTLGVLVVTLNFNTTRDFDSVLKFLTLVASALLQPIRMHQEIRKEKEKLESENVNLKQKLQDEHKFSNIIGNSHEMRDVYGSISQVSGSDTTVLIRGESGTGKELIAEAIHYNSDRMKRSIVRVNCAAIPENLIETEFFGHEKGAFTGALNRKKGKFELADGGTIFLDEIGALSPATQVKLLRVLQERQFERVGGNETIDVNIRLIAATNADLEQLILDGKFREDLYYRLNVFSIFLPPLRERKTDILLLADHFLLKYGRKQGKAIKRISTPAIDMLMRYHWPGNVRELENCIERATLVCTEQVIHSYHLPPTLQTAESSDTRQNQSLHQAVEAYEKELIQDTLKSTNGNKSKAARLLNTTNRIIGYKIEKYNINPVRFKS